MKLLHVLIMALGVSLCGGFVGLAIVKFKRLDNFVEVRGHSEKIVKSDIAIWNISFVAASDDIPTLNKEVTRIQGAVLAHLKSSGFREEDISRSAVSVNDNQTDQYAKKVGPRYRASGGITLRTAQVDEVTKSSQNMDELLKTGIVLSGSSVRYYFTQLNGVKTEMLKEATASARDAATSFAEDSGASVGRMKAVWQGLFSIGSPVEDYDSGASIMKKVRVVMTAQYFLQ